METRLTAYGELVLILSAIYHFVVGSFSMLSVAWTRKVARALYALDLPRDLDPRYEYTWKPLGAYAIFTGWMALVAYRARETPFAAEAFYGLAFLFFLRAAMRWVYRDLFQRAYGVGIRRNATHIVFNLALVVSLLAFGVSSATH
jgi:hypothetical protein